MKNLSSARITLIILLSTLGGFLTYIGHTVYTYEFWVIVILTVLISIFSKYDNRK